MPIDRIVTIHDFCIPRGGASLLAVEAAMGFARRGYRSTFLSGEAGSNPALTDVGVEIFSLGHVAVREASPKDVFLKALYNPQAKEFIGDWIKQNDTPGTVYHLHNWVQIFSPSILKALEPVLDRLVLSAHDFFHVCPNGGFSLFQTGEVCTLKPMTVSCIRTNCDKKNYGFKLWRVARQAVRNTMFDTQAPVPILIIHERMREFFVRSGVHNEWIKTLPNPIRPFAAERIRAEENDELVFIGRMETTKGPDLAAAAARRAGVKMRFIGTGGILDEMRSEFPEMIFDGYVKREEIHHKLSKARAIVVPSRYPEPYGLVIVEALWSGLPVIISDTAFLADDLVAAGAGIALAPQDEQSFATAINTIFADDDLARSMSLAARDNTHSLGNTPDAWLDTLIQVFDERLSAAAH